MAPGASSAIWAAVAPAAYQPEASAASQWRARMTSIAVRTQ